MSWAVAPKKNKSNSCCPIGNLIVVLPLVMFQERNSYFWRGNAACRTQDYFEIIGHNYVYDFLVTIVERVCEFPCDRSRESM
jgi:hypothetical protein